MFAALWGRPDVATRLIEAGAGVNVTIMGYSALLRFGADTEISSEIPMVGRVTPLEYASAHQNAEIAHLLTGAPFQNQ
jgi:hypothetical protein